MGYNSLTGLGSHAGEANTWFRMQDNAASTQVTDSSGNGNHGTLQGGRTTADLSVAGDAWSTLALQGDGIADYIDFAAATTAAFNTEHTAVLRWKNKSVASGADVHWGLTGSATSAFFADNAGNRMRYRQGAANLGLITRTLQVDEWDGIAISFEFNQAIRYTYDGTSADGSTATANAYTPGVFMRRQSTYSPLAYREFILFDRTTTDDERLALLAGPEPLYIGPAITVSQTTRYCAPSGAPAWDAQGNGTPRTVYLWEVADDASGTNAQPRSRSNRFFPSAADAGKHVRLTISGENPEGNVDDAETQVTAWVPLTAAGPTVEGKTAVVRGALNNAGTTDFTVPGFGNVAGAIFIYMKSNGSTPVERDSSLGFGFESWTANGAVNNAQYNTHARRDDGATSGDFAWRGQTLTYPIFLTFTGQSWSAAPIADGVRLTVATTGTDQMECTVILFDENCQIETGDVGATSGQFDSVNFAFQPSIVFQANGCAPFTGTAASSFTNVGAFDNDGNAVQICGSTERNNIPTDIGLSITSGDWARQYAYGSISWTATPSWANSGFTMDLSGGGGAGTDIIPWFAIGNIGAKCGTYQVPNSVSPGVGPFAIPYSGPTSVIGETALFLDVLLNANGNSPGTAAAWFGFGVDDGADPHHYGIYQKYNASPATQMASTFSDQSQTVWYDGGTAPLELVKGTVTSFDQGEMTVDYTALGGNNYAAGYIVFGQTGTAPPAGNWRPFQNMRFNSERFTNGAF